MKILVHTTLLLILSLTLNGCRKSSDDIPPQIERLLPLSNSVFLQFEGQVEFSYEVNDNLGLENYQAFLKNESGQVVWSKGGQIDGTSATVYFFIFHDDPHWVSGLYLLSVQVEDKDGNTANDFLDIQVSAAPLELKEVLVYSDDPGQTSTIHELQDNNMFDQVSTIDHDLHSVGISSWNQTITLGGDQLPFLSFLDAGSYQVTNQYEGQNPLSGNFVTDMFEHPESHDLFVATFDQQISRYGPTGSLEFTFQTNQNYRPIQLSAWEQFVIAIVDPVNNSDQLLNLYYVSSGALYLSLPLDFSVTEMMVWNDRLVIVGNDDQNTPRLKVFDLQTESVYEPSWLISGNAVTSARYLEGNWFALGHTDGVFIQNFETNSFFDGSNNGLNVLSLDFDPIAGQVYALTQEELNTIALNGATITSSIPAPPGSRFVRLLFNR